MPRKIRQEMVAVDESLGRDRTMATYDSTRSISLWRFSLSFFSTHHSDRGLQSANKEFQALLKTNDIRVVCEEKVIVGIMQWQKDFSTS